MTDLDVWVRVRADAVSSDGERLVAEMVDGSVKPSGGRVVLARVARGEHRDEADQNEAKKDVQRDQRAKSGRDMYIEDAREDEVNPAEAEKRPVDTSTSKRIDHLREAGQGEMGQALVPGVD